MPRGKWIKPGDIYDKIEVLKVYSEKTTHKPKMYSCKCLICNSIFVSSGQNVLRYQAYGCPACRENAKLEMRETEYQKYIGRKFEKLEIIGYSGMREYSGKKRVPFMVCSCVCGTVSEIPLARLKAGQSKQCNKCAEKNLELGHEFLKIDSVSETKITAIDGRRATNKNSTTGHKGVSFHGAKGKYRAYINFQRKQYWLGYFKNLDDAIAARKEAEKKIYGDFLGWYAQKYPEQWARILKSKK